MNQERLSELRTALQAVIEGFPGLTIRFEIQESDGPPTTEYMAEKAAAFHGYTFEGIRRKAQTKHLVACRMSCIRILNEAAPRYINPGELGSLFNLSRGAVNHAIKATSNLVTTKDKYFLQIHEPAIKQFRTWIKQK